MRRYRLDWTMVSFHSRYVLFSVYACDYFNLPNFLKSPPPSHSVYGSQHQICPPRLWRWQPTCVTFLSLNSWEDSDETAIRSVLPLRYFPFCVFVPISVCFLQILLRLLQQYWSCSSLAMSNLSGNGRTYAAVAASTSLNNVAVKMEVASENTTWRAKWTWDPR